MLWKECVPVVLLSVKTILMPLINVGLSKERNIPSGAARKSKANIWTCGDEQIEGADSLETIPLLSRSQVK